MIGERGRVGAGIGELRAEVRDGIEESDLEGGEGVVGILGYLEFKWGGDDIGLVGEDAGEKEIVRGGESEWESGEVLGGGSFGEEFGEE